MLALYVLGFACAPPPTIEPRTAWLVDALVRDNAVWLSRDPQLVRTKFATMAGDPYAYLRGTLGVAWADETRPGSTRTPTSFLNTPDADLIWLVGDPHPENFSFFAAPHLPTSPYNLPLCVDVEDFDGSGHGPWIWDVRRLALGVRLAAALSQACDAACGLALVDAVADGYADGVFADAPEDLCAPKTEGYALALAADGAERSALEGTTMAETTERTVFEPRRRFRTTTGPDTDGDGLVPLTDGERAQVERLWLLQPDLPHDARIVDAARRFGAGVASLPAIRYLILWDQGDEASDADDRLLQFREVVDPPAIPGRFRPVPAALDDATQRVRAPADALWSHPDLDPWLMGLSDGAQTFKRTSWGDLPAGLEADDLAEDLAASDVTPDDVAALAYALARRIADAHRRGPTLGATASTTVLRAELTGRRETLRRELRQASETDLDLLFGDVLRLRDALDRLGPDLGATALDRPWSMEPE